MQENNIVNEAVNEEVVNEVVESTNGIDWKKVGATAGKVALVVTGGYLIYKGCKKLFSKKKKVDEPTQEAPVVDAEVEENAVNEE